MDSAAAFKFSATSYRVGLEGMHIELRTARMTSHKSRTVALARVLAVVAAGLAAALPLPLAAQGLNDALTAAYQSNPTLMAARADLRSVNEGVPQALSDYRPEVLIDASLGLQRRDTNTRSAETTEPLEAELSVDQPLYRGGRTVAAVAGAEALVNAGRAELIAVEQTVLLDAAVAYMDVWRDQAVLKLNEGNEEVLTRQLEATQDRFEVGELTRTDVAQSESRLARATATRIASEGDLAASRAVFEEVVGLAPGVLEAPSALDGLPGSRDEAVEAALEANPVLTGARFTEEAARHQIDVARGQLYPELSLTGEASHSEETATQDSETQRLLGQVEITVPLYQRGLVSSQVRENKQRALQRRREIDEALRRVKRLAVASWEQLKSTEAQRESFGAEVRSAEIALEGVRQENAVGARTILDVLDAEQELLDAQVSLARARRDEIVAGFAVFSAMGRLTARNLALGMDVYDPEVDYRAVRDRWFGLDAPGE